MANIEKNKKENSENRQISSVKKVKEKVEKLSWWAKLFLFCFFGGIFLVFSLLVAINIPAVKNDLAEKAIDLLNNQYKTEFKTENVEINFLGDVVITGVSVKDHRDFEFFKVQKLTGHSDWFELIFNSRDLKFQKLSLEEMDLKVITYKGEEQDNFTKFIEKFETPRDPKKTPFKFTSRIQIKDSKVSIVNENQGEDGKWLKADKVNAYVSRLHTVGPNVKLKMNQFSFVTDRWGKKHILENLSGDLSITEEKFEFTDLTLHTNHSLLQGDLTFNLNKETKWQDFNNKVGWDMNLKRGSYLNGYDISYFVKNWDNPQKYSLFGKMKGVLNDFMLTNFEIKHNEVKIQTPEIKFSKLLEGDFQIKANKLSADLTYPALRNALPTFISEKMGGFADDFGKIKYEGFADINKQRVIAKGNLATDIGRAVVEDFTLSEYSSAFPKYMGQVALNDFNSSVITKQKEVGLISGNVFVDGQGFDLKTLSLTTKSNLSSIEILGKKLHHFNVNGDLIAKQFNGFFEASDNSFRGKINGKIDFSQPRFFADVKGNIEHFDLKYWGITDVNSHFKGDIDAILSMTNINDLDLDANLKSVSLLGQKNIRIPSGEVKLTMEEGNRIIHTDIPNAINGRISGKFDLENIGEMFQEGISKILIGNKAKKYYTGQSFAMDIEIHQDLVDYFEPNVHIPDGAKIVGDFNGNSNDFAFDVQLPTLKYIMETKEEISEADRLLAQANPQYIIRENVKRDSAMVQDISLKINTENPSEYWGARVGRVVYQGSLLKDIQISAEEREDNLHIETNLYIGTLEKEKNNEMVLYTANVDQFTNEEGDYVFKFDPTELKVSKFMWMVDTSPELNHYITYRKKIKEFDIHNLKIYSDNSEVLVNGTFKNAKDFNLNGNLKNLDISKVWAIAFQDSKVDLRGIANGDLKLTMNPTQLVPDIDIKVENISVNQRKIGDLILSADNGLSPNIYEIDAKIQEEGFLAQDKLTLKGTIDNNTQSPTLDLKANLNKFDLAFIQAFVQDIFTDFRGNATGEIGIDGTLRDMNYGGDIAVKDFGLKLNFSGVDYVFDDTVVTLSNGNMFFNFVGVKDSRTNSKGMISIGQLNLLNLSNIGAELLIRADDLMILNTTQSDFDVFWGKIYAKGDLFVGYNNNALAINATADILQNSVFTLNSNSTSSVEEFKMLRFLEVDDEGKIALAEKKRNGVALNVDLDITADKNSTVNVLVGDEVGDISVRGNTKNMKFSMDRTGNMRLFGGYEVESGTYVSKAILEKIFQIQRGSNLQWNGDVMNPELNIVATYDALVSNASEYLEMGSLPVLNVQLQTNITNRLTNPVIKPSIVIENASSQVKDIMSYKLATEEEKVLQFASILALGNFNVSNTNASSAIGSGVNVFFKQLSSAFNSLSDMFQVDIGYIARNTSTNTTDRATTNVSVKISPRWRLKTGVGVPISSTENAQDNYLSGEGIVEYDWSKNIDGSRVFRVYSKPSNVGTVTGTNAGANQAYGGGVVLSYGFNRILPERKNKIKKQKEAMKDSIQAEMLKK